MRRSKHGFWDGRAVVQFDGALEEAPRRSEVSVSPKHKVDRGTGTIDGSVQVLALAADFDVGLVHPPGHAHRALAPAKHCRQHRKIWIDHRWTVAYRRTRRARPSPLQCDAGSAGRLRSSARRPASPPTGSAAAGSLCAVPASSRSSSRRNRNSLSVQAYCDRTASSACSPSPRNKRCNSTSATLSVKTSNVRLNSYPLNAPMNILAQSAKVAFYSRGAGPGLNRR